MLTSGRQIDNKVEAPKQPGNTDKDQLEEEVQVTKEHENEQTKDNTVQDNVATPPIGPPPKPFVLKAPFPQRLQSLKNSMQNANILDIFKQVKINIPLLDAIKQIPLYANFLKDLCTIKRKLNVEKKAFLMENVSFIIQHHTPPKYKDPSCPTISCIIGNYRLDQALLDLGAIVYPTTLLSL